MTQDAAVLEASDCQSHDVVVPDFVCFCFQEAWDKGFYMKFVKIGETFKALVSHYAVGPDVNQNCAPLLWVLEMPSPSSEDPG